jgi:hypothetical protein
MQATSFLGLLNTLLEGEVPPDNWNEAIIIPIFKKKIIRTVEAAEELVC